MGYGHFGDVFINGQMQDVWCNSKRVIADLSVYKDKEADKIFDYKPSCYFAFSQKLHSKNTFTFGQCTVDGLDTIKTFFLCN